MAGFKKKILIVGGAGYIGSHMVLDLQDRGYEPIVFDNLSRGFADAVNGAHLVRGDLASKDDINACLQAHDFDLVMHFAALAYVHESVSDPESYFRNNVVGTLNLLAAMRSHGLDKLVFSSTCATYGASLGGPISEIHPQQPVNPYGRSKLMIEQALEDYALAYGFNSISLRYFNAAGCDAQGRAGERHEPETHLIPLILDVAWRLGRGEAAVNSRPFSVCGNDFDTPDGSCVRDYVHVTDLCSAHWLAARRLLSGETVGAEAFNLANGTGFSVFDVIDTCCEVTQQKIPFAIGPRRPGDPAVLIGDARKAKAVLNWQPKISELKPIIRSAWSWMNSRRESWCLEAAVSQPAAGHLAVSAMGLHALSETSTASAALRWGEKPHGTSAPQPVRAVNPDTGESPASSNPRLPRDIDKAQ